MGNKEVMWKSKFWPNPLEMACAIACLSSDRPRLRSQILSVPAQRCTNDLRADFWRHVMRLRADPLLFRNRSVTSYAAS
jgi:hypothetical protein